MNRQAEPRTLVLCWGNPSRGDDALGPLFAEKLVHLKFAGIEILQDFQLQIEYALDLEQRDRLLFVDAASSGQAPFECRQIQAERDSSYTSHSLSPQALLAVYQQTRQQHPPPTYLLTIRGYSFELGSPLSDQAECNLDQALDFARGFLIG